MRHQPTGSSHGIMRTLDLTEAATFLHVHPHTLEAKARAGEVPAAKPGKCWVFLDVDLAEWLRAQYRTAKGKSWHSTNAGASGGANGQSAAPGYIAGYAENASLTISPTVISPARSSSPIPATRSNRRGIHCTAQHCRRDFQAPLKYQRPASADRRATESAAAA